MKIRIMISSTRADLMQYREEAARIITKIAKDIKEKHQIIDVSMEEQTLSGNLEFAVEVSKKWVEEAYWIVLIVGWHYGTISDEPGADGLGVTEWEHRHAIKLNKKVFAFVAGEQGSADPYRATEDEKFDLKDWMAKSTERQRQQLRCFKEELARHHIQYFRNLKHFGERLEATLRRAIDDLPPDIPPGSRLAELILEVKPEFVRCLKSVKLLATAKDIHDSLHDLRRSVVSRLQEEILPAWRRENRLSATQCNILSKRAMDTERLLGKIEGFARDLNGDSQDLKDRINRLVKSDPLWDPEANPEPRFEEFAEKVDNFASDVQHSFTEADEAMLRKQLALSNFHSALLERIGKARGERYLSPKEEVILDGELGKIARNKDRLIKALNLHHKWQGLHDKIEYLHTQRDTNNFPKQLSRFIDNELSRLARLVDDELGAFMEPEAPLADDGAILALNKERCVGDGEASRHEQGLRDGLPQMRTYMANLTERRDDQAFHAMRRWFDEAFYWVDKRTLSEVDRSRERVKGSDRLLDNLATHGKAQSDHPEPDDRP